MSRRDSSEQSQQSYIRRFNLIAGSALEEAECFVTSLKALQASFNQTNSLPTLEKDLKETMDQYVRLTMVCDVLKVFNPFTSPSPSPAPNTSATTTTTTTTSYPHVKEEVVDIKPAHLLRASPPLPSPKSSALVRNEVVPPSSSVPVMAPPSQPQVPVTVNQTRQPAVFGDSQVRHNHPQQQQQQAQPAPIMNNSRQATTSASINMNNANINTTNTPPLTVSAAAIPRSIPPASHSMPNLNTNNNQSSSNNNRSSPPDTERKEGISTTHFIKTFEAILTYFANTNKLQVDDTWEKLFIHSLPPQQKNWFTTKIQGKQYTWEHAKSIFYQDFTPKKPDNKDKTVARQTRYAEALLNLEMQDNDNIRLFNEKFKRYSERARMTCDGSLLKRYVNSLASHYRNLAMPLLSHPEYANNLDAIMKHVERLEQPGLVEVEAPCSHNWSMGNDFKSTWSNNNSQKRRASHVFESAEKRQRPQPVPQY